MSWQNKSARKWDQTTWDEPSGHLEWDEWMLRFSGQRCTVSCDQNAIDLSFDGGRVARVVNVRVKNEHRSFVARDPFSGVFLRARVAGANVINKPGQELVVAQCKLEFEMDSGPETIISTNEHDGKSGDYAGFRFAAG